MSELATKDKNKLFNLTLGFLVSRSLHIASYYKIFDELINESKTAEQIAKNKNLNPKNLKALLMVLANHKVIEIDGNEHFSLTSISKYLVSNTTNSVQPFIAKFFDKRYWNAVGNIDTSLENDISPFKSLYGETFYQYLEHDKEAANLFNNGMAVFSINEDIAVSEVYDYSGFSIICDVGGGRGGLINNILSKHANLKGIILELASTDFISNQDTAISTRLTYSSGDFFETVPNADAFILKRVLHNWNDEECIKILSNCLKSLNNLQKGKIFIVEEVLPTIPDGSLLIDGIMIALAFGSIERTLEDFIILCNKVGLKFEQKLDTTEGISVLVFEPNN